MAHAGAQGVRRPTPSPPLVHWRPGSHSPIDARPTPGYAWALGGVAVEVGRRCRSWGEAALAEHLLGAIVAYALVNTTLPGLLLRAAPPDFASPEAPRAGVESAEPTET